MLINWNSHFSSSARNLIPVKTSPEDCGFVAADEANAKDGTSESQSPKRGKDIALIHFWSSRFWKDLLQKRSFVDAPLRQEEGEISRMRRSVDTLSSHDATIDVVDSSTLVNSASQHHKTNDAQLTAAKLVFPPDLVPSKVNDEPKKKEPPRRDSVPDVGFDDSLIDIAEYADEEIVGSSSYVEGNFSSEEESLTYEFGSTPPEQPVEVPNVSSDGEMAGPMIVSQLEEESMEESDLPPVAGLDDEVVVRGDPIISLKKGDLNSEGLSLNGDSRGPRQLIMGDDPGAYSFGKPNLWRFHDPRKAASASNEKRLRNNSIASSSSEERSGSDKEEQLVQDQPYILEEEDGHEEELYVYKQHKKGGSADAFRAFSTLLRDKKFKKGGQESLSSLRPLKKTRKGGRPTVLVGPIKRGHYKRSTRDNPDSRLPPSREARTMQWGSEDQTSINRPATTLDKEDKGNTAYDLFPHIFEYDLPEHDDYYYEDEEADTYWFNRYWTPDADLPSTGNSAYDDPYDFPFEYDHTIETPSSTPAPPARVESEQQLPSGLKSMALTREEFAVDIPSHPKVTKVNGEEKSSPASFEEYEDVRIVPLKDPVLKGEPYEASPDGSKIPSIHPNDVYIQSTTPVAATSTTVQDRKTVPITTETWTEKVTSAPTTAKISEPSYKEETSLPPTSTPTTTTTTPKPTTAKEVLSELIFKGKESLRQEPKVEVIKFNESTGTHSKRVTVNVTIATEDDSPSSDITIHEKPVYVLSVSVPTSGENQGPAQISIGNPHVIKGNEKATSGGAEAKLSKLKAASTTPEDPSKCSCPCGSGSANEPRLSIKTTSANCTSSAKTDDPPLPMHLTYDLLGKKQYCPFFSSYVYLYMCVMRIDLNSCSFSLLFFPALQKMIIIVVEKELTNSCMRTSRS